MAEAEGDWRMWVATGWGKLVADERDQRNQWQGRPGEMELNWWQPSPREIEVSSWRLREIGGVGGGGRERPEKLVAGKLVAGEAKRDVVKLVVAKAKRD